MLFVSVCDTAGESYAGAYIPWMADYIINQQRGDNGKASLPRSLASPYNC